MLNKMSKLLFILLVVVQALFAKAASEKPYVLLISFDGFRWDYTERGITPNMRQMAKEGVQALSFQPAFPSKTFPNHYSIVTGLYPQNHRLINNRFINPFNNERYQVGDSISVRNAKWYGGEALWETAQRQGVLSASFFWPGSEVNLSYRRPTYFKRYDGSVALEQRIEGIIKWLQLPGKKRPHLLFLYFSNTDTQGHRFGPNSPQINQAIRFLDRELGVLFKKLDKIGMKDSVNVILVSDHGMTRLLPKGLIKLQDILNNRKVRMTGYGPLVQFFTRSDKEKEALYRLLSKHAKGFNVYKKEEIPEYFHYSKNAFIGDIIAVANLGYSFIRNNDELKKVLKRRPQGDHGYDNHTLDMQGIFLACGPAFKVNYRCSTLWNIDVYPLVCKVLGLVPNQEIDGRLERIGFILK